MNINKLSVLFLVLLLIVSSCTKKKNSNEKVLNLVSTNKVKGMDPIYANDLYSSREVGRVYESLLEYHYLKRPYVLKPNLAESMPKVSSDGLTYTFKIKKGVYFHDDVSFPGGKGRELVASDFVYSIKRLADPKLQGLGWWLLDGKLAGLNKWRKENATKAKVDYKEEVEGLKALDKYTLQFKLAKPFPQFLYSLAMTFTSAVAKEVVDHYGKEFLNHPVGTGAFVLPVFKQGNRIVYTKNLKFRNKTYPCDASEEFNNSVFLADCGKKLPLVDKLIINIVIEDQPRWLNFKRGKFDWVSVPKDNFQSAIPDSKNLSAEFSSKGVTLLVSPSLDVTYTAFNHDMKLLQNVKLRRAMMMAFDITKSNKLFFNSTALPAQSIVPPGIAGYDKNYKNPYKNYGTAEMVTKAKAMLAEAGYAGGKGLPEITYDTVSSTVGRQGGEYLKKQMAKVGINIKVVQNTWPELQKKITNRNIMLYGIAWSADYPDAENFLQLLYGPNKAPGANGSDYDNPVFNSLFKKAAVMQDSPERTAIYEKLNRMAAELVPLIYGVHRQTFVVKQGWIKNFVNTDFEQGRAQYLNIDLKNKEEMLKKF